MATVLVDLTSSLDGFIAAANDGPDQPLGEGGARHINLEILREVDSPGVTHLRYRVR